MSLYDPASVQQRDEFFVFPLTVPTPRHARAVLDLLSAHSGAHPVVDHDGALVAIVATHAAYRELIAGAAQRHARTGGAR